MFFVVHGVHYHNVDMVTRLSSVVNADTRLIMKHTTSLYSRLLAPGGIRSSQESFPFLPSPPLPFPFLPGENSTSPAGISPPSEMPIINTAYDHVSHQNYVTICRKLGNSTACTKWLTPNRIQKVF